MAVGNSNSYLHCISWLWFVIKLDFIELAHFLGHVMFVQ